MRKIFFTLITGIFFCVNFASAQVNVAMSSSEVDQGANASVDVTTSNFINLIGLQFSVNYDSLILEFSNVSNINTAALRGLSAGSIGLPNAASAAIKKGQLTFAWDDPGPGATGTFGVTLPANTRLFTINFKAIGAKGTQSDVVTSNTPRRINVVYSDFTENQNLTNTKGTVKIKGDGPQPTTCVDPVCTNPNALTFTGAVVTAQKDQTICVPITVKNFKIMQSGQGSIKWDPAVLQYTEVKTPASGGIPNFAGGFNAAGAATGEFKYLWFNDQPGSPLTLPDNTVVMELCFKVLAATGTGCIQIGLGTLETIWEDDKGSVPVCYSYGKINIGDPGTPVKIKTGTASGKKGDIVCVDVTVEDFDNIFGLQTKFGWDPTQLKFVRTEGYGLDGLNQSVFSNTNNILNLAWTNGNALSRPDGHVIFKICFELLCPSSTNYTANITVPGPTDVTGTVSNAPAMVPSTATGGSISVNCTMPQDPICTVGTITPVACNGQSNGSVAITVTNGDACNYQWKTSAGTIIKSGAVSAGNLSLTGVGAGTYTFEVVCNGIVSTSCQAIVTQPSVITIPNAGVVTNAACGGKGAINISATSGGNGGYQYNWNPAQGNIPNPSGLDAGTYSVTVTDSKGCTATGSFTVGNTQTALSPVTLTPTNVKCNGGSDGAILVNVSGGCTPYTYTWTGGLLGANPQNVKAGTYTVTVTDGATPAQTGTATITITEPAPLSVTVTSTTPASSSTATDGKIKLAISGGTKNYRIMWSGGIPDGQTNDTLEIDKLKAGFYNVTVTDANGCTAVRNGIEVTVKPVTDEKPELGTVSVTSNFTGFGIKCFGESNGVISGTLTKGTYPVTVTLRAGSNPIGSPQSITIADFTFNNLAAGTYTVTAQNSAGIIVSQAITITQPTKLNAASPTRECTEKDKETGSIEINMGNTGAGNYGYKWSHDDKVNTNKAEGLAEGFYNVTVTDANLCELRLTNIEVNECFLGGDCFTSTSIITPDGDGVNDLFIINCATDNSSDLSVFDRWGKLVYSQANYDNTWRGIDADNEDLREGAYIWVLNVNFGQGRREIYKGTVTLLRGQ